MKTRQCGEYSFALSTSLKIKTYFQSLIKRYFWQAA